MSIVKTKGLVHEFIRRDEEDNVESITTALDHVDLRVEPGEFIAILGHNGSGKSTLAKHINALLTASEGTIWVDGMDVSEEENVIPVRKSAGMVFQNPDNQIVASVVEEDVAFGPENIGVPTEEIWERVEKSLKNVGMTKYRTHSPNKLSGGQKQRVAIAGVIAMEPEVLILDEPTAGLDPEGRAEILANIERYRKEMNATIMMVSHSMEDVARMTDRLLVLCGSRIAMEGTPSEVFESAEELVEMGLSIPQVTQVFLHLKKMGMDIGSVYTIEQAVEALKKLRGGAYDA